MPLEELASSSRVVGIKEVTRKLRAGLMQKVFLSKEANPELLNGVLEAVKEQRVETEWVANSLQLGRACAITRKTAAAGLLKK